METATIVAAAIGIVAGLAVTLLKDIRAKVAKTETKVDDQILKAIDDAIAKSKEAE